MSQRGCGPDLFGGPGRCAFGIESGSDLSRRGLVGLAFLRSATSGEAGGDADEAPAVVRGVLGQAEVAHVFDPSTQRIYDEAFAS